MAGRLADLKVMIANLKSSPDKIVKLDQALPLDGNVVRLKILIDAISAGSGVVVGDISVSSSKADAVVAGDKALLANPFGTTRTLQKLTGSIYVIGTFPQLKAFMEKLEASGRLVDVSDVSIDGASAGNLNLRLAFTSYYLAP